MTYQLADGWSEDQIRGAMGENALRVLLAGKVAVAVEGGPDLLAGAAGVPCRPIPLSRSLAARCIRLAECHVDLGTIEVGEDMVGPECDAASEVSNCFGTSIDLALVLDG